jgi:hypothetical protein
MLKGKFSYKSEENSKDVLRTIANTLRIAFYALMILKTFNII